jgi:hypothetical protein
MAKRSLFNLFRAAHDEATEMLDTLGRNRTPIQVEVEQSTIRFSSQLSLKGSSILIAKPSTLGNVLHRGGYVRNGSVGFVCKTPEGSAMPKRKHDRYDTSRFSNLRLEVGAVSFRLLDLGPGGCRLATTPETSHAKIHLGRAMEQAVLVVGKDSKVAFERLVPRAQRKGFIGCEFTIKQDGVSPKLFAQVLQSVQTRQLDSLSAR